MSLTPPSLKPIDAIQPQGAIPPRAKTPHQGFTLVEVMVALFVFAVGVTSLIVAQTNSLVTTNALQDRLYAEIVAENQLIDAITGVEDLATGFSYGEEEQAGRVYFWSRQARPSGTDTIQWIEVQVSRKADHPAEQNSQPVLVALSGLRRQN